MTEEMERHTFRSRGQAVSYFDGYTRLREIRSAVERELGAKFNVQRFHDLIFLAGIAPSQSSAKGRAGKFCRSRAELETPHNSGTGNPDMNAETTGPREKLFTKSQPAPR